MPPKANIAIAIINNNNTYSHIRAKMLADAQKYFSVKANQNAKNWRRVDFRNHFFRNVKGGYGYPDQFLGFWTGADLKVLKEQIQKSGGLPHAQLKLFCKDRLHEVRVLGWMFLRDSSRDAFQKLEKMKARATSNQQLLADDSKKQLAEQTLKQNVDLLLQTKNHLKNWDEVDTVARWVLGTYLCHSFPGNPKKRLEFLSKTAQLSYDTSPLWSQRLAVVCTHAMICEEECDDEIYALAQQFLDHKHDLMHKAVGWMLREAGLKCGKAKLTTFLNKNHTKMPRVMLSYSTEKFSAVEKSRYARKK